MYCSACGQKNKDQARFCKTCGSPLGGVGASVRQPVTHVPQVGNGVMPVSKNSLRKKPLVVIAVTLVVCVLVAAGVLAWLLLRPKPVAPLPRKDAVALFNDGTQLVAGKDGTARMKIRAPKDAGQIAVRNDTGTIVASFDPESMKDGGDGNLWADVEIQVPKSDPGAVRFTVSVEDEQSQSSPGSEVQSDSSTAPSTQEAPDAPGDGSSMDSVFVPVVPEIPPVPVPQKAEDAWVLSDACDWVDATYKDRGSESYVPEEAGDALVAHLKEDGRVRLAVRYGSTVIFCTTDWSLYGVALRPLADGMLGAGEDHALSSTGPAIEAFLSFQNGRPIEPGSGITAGNTATSGDVLLLNSTPSLMDEGSFGVVRAACEQYADAVGGKATVVEGNDVLPALLRGDLYGKGVADLHAHGLEAAGSGTSFMLMTSISKDAKSAWRDVRSELSDCLASVGESSSVDVGTLFFGDASVPNTWRCATVAVVAAEVGSWNVGISATPNLLEWRYGQAPFDNSVLWLSSCGGLADTSFASWAVAHNAQLVVGYTEVVGQKEDAEAFANMLGGLSAPPARLWRSANVGELLDTSLSTVAAQSDQTADDVAKGNASFFVRGTGSLVGRVVTKEGNPVAGVQMEVWRYFGSSFVSVGKTTTGDNGVFEYVGMPCGRYVVCVEADEITTTHTVVVDEEYVDLGDVLVGMSDGKLVEDTPAASVGVGNASIACDGEYYYIAKSLASNTTYDDKLVRPVVVRIGRDDKSRCELLWQADYYTTPESLCSLAMTDGRLIVTAAEHVLTSSPVVSHSYSMNLDGSDVVSLTRVDSSPSSYGKTNVIVARDRVVYVTGHGEYNPSEWQVRMCSLQGEGDELVCSVPNHVSSGQLSLIGEEDGYVYLALSGAQEGGGRRAMVYRASIAGGDGGYQQIASGTGSNAFMVDGRLYVTEAADVVSYDSSGADRKVVATLEDANSNCDLMNINSMYALVFATSHSESQLVGGIWRVDLETGAKERIYSYPEFYHCQLELVDDEIYGCMLGGDVFELGDELQEVRRVWPPEDGVSLVFAQKTLLSHDALLAQARAQGMTILTGTVNEHYEDWYSGRGNIVSITLDEPIDFQYEYKGINDATAHEVGLSSSSAGDYSCWATLTGKHVTLVCEKLHGVYHDAAMTGTDSTAIYPHYLFS